MAQKGQIEKFSFFMDITVSACIVQKILQGILLVKLIGELLYCIESVMPIFLLDLKIISQ